VRLYMKELHPYFKLYVSPINIDPFDASLPISNPPEFASELAEELGRFYTQGFPADTKALSNGVLSDEEYFQQARIVLDENLRSFEYQLRNFHEGLFFFYFSTLDQNQHMLWRNMDPTHPLFEENAPDEVKTAVKYFYTSLDDVVRQALEKADSNTTIFILSDHGFAPFKREFHLNTWLLENGYMALKEPEKRLEGEFFKNVDWEKTRAFGLGINGLYINVRDREKFGNVLKSEAKLLKQELASKLAEVRDPLNNEAFITKAYDSQEIYRGNFKEMAPDLVLGFTSGYRTSDISVLGSFAKEVVSDRTDKWAGDHCIDPAVVPGVFMSNRDCSTDKKAIWDVAPTILKAFGIETPPEMEGRSQLKV
jgi:predicted AlkP superfamily phosphohydrolase/phosphomutase